jgi:hypothetical protein
VTEQILRDRLADTEKYLERFAALTVEIAMLKVAQGAAASKGHVADEVNRLMGQVRTERERAMNELKTEMKAAFGDAIEDAFKRYGEGQQKTIRLYTRIGAALLLILLAKDAGSIWSVGRTMLGMP